ncbi:IS66 family transposase [Bradyrhizobium sp. PMVTL-01]|uniref:IS66 family transposase n=1 Tax=Bradyrhizobium sp. PMVTL-01 TaxID=3434999 RepID=UPI003F72E66D
MQCEACDGYDRLTEVARPQGRWTLVHCWSHLRRRFVTLARNSKSPIAEVRSGSSVLPIVPALKSRNNCR